MLFCAPAIESHIATIDIGLKCLKHFSLTGAGGVEINNTFETLAGPLESLRIEKPAFKESKVERLPWYWCLSLLVYMVYDDDRKSKRNLLFITCIHTFLTVNISRDCTGLMWIARIACWVDMSCWVNRIPVTEFTLADSQSEHVYSSRTISTLLYMGYTLIANRYTLK